MNEQDKARIINRFNERIKKEGVIDSILAVGSREHHELRFKIMSEIGDLNDKNILDLGCGFGSFYQFLYDNRILVNYVGYDINCNMIKEATRRYPDVNFQIVDVLNEDFPKFDYILSSTSFNLKLNSENNYAFIERLLNICYKHSNIGVSMDFLSSYVDFTTEDAFHYEPEKIFEIAKKISKRVTLRHDYELFEFTIYIYKDFQGWRKNE